MKKKILNVVKTLIFISVGVLLFWLVYRKQDFSQMWGALKHSHWGWIFVAMVLGIFSHISRVMRWQLLIEPLGYKPRGVVLFFTVMIMYLSNLAIPRSGEVLRCATASKYERVPFTVLLGTVVTERIIDMLMMFILLILAIIIQFSHILKFWHNNPGFQHTIAGMSKYIPYLIALTVASIAFVIAMIVFRKRLRNSKLLGGIYKIIEDFGRGIISIIHMKKKWQFIGHSIFIWTMYFLMMYVIFFAFDFTSFISLTAGFVVFIMATLGMAFPSPGGMGSWDFMAIESLKLYGVSAEHAATYSLITHASQIILLITFGLLSLVALSFVKPLDQIQTLKKQNDEQ